MKRSSAEELLVLLLNHPGIKVPSSLVEETDKTTEGEEDTDSSSDSSEQPDEEESTSGDEGKSCGWACSFSLSLHTLSIPCSN